MPVHLSHWTGEKWVTQEIHEGTHFELMTREADSPALLNTSVAAIPGDRVLKIVQKNNKGQEIVTVLNCRRKKITNSTDPNYDDVAVIQHNTATNQVCWFNSKDQSLDSTNIPSPWRANRQRNDPDDIQAKLYWGTPQDIAQNPRSKCLSCHNGSLWIRTPFIKQAEKDKRQGVDNSLPELDPDTELTHVGEPFKSWNNPKKKPLKIRVNQAAFDTKFPPARKGLASSDTCTQCHTIGRNQLTPNAPQLHDDEGAFQGGCGMLAWDAIGTGKVKDRHYSNFGKTFPASRWMPPGVADQFFKKYGHDLGKKKFDEYFQQAKAALEYCCTTPPSDPDFEKLCLKKSTATETSSTTRPQSH